MLLKEACDYFGWPTEAAVIQPPGAGAAVCAATVAQRIREPLKRRFPGLTVESGILTVAPGSAATASPLAIVHSSHIRI